VIDHLVRLLTGASLGFPLVHDGYLTAIPGYWMLLPALPVAWWIWRHGSTRGLDGPADRRWTFFALLALGHVTAVVALTIFPIPVAGQEYYRITRGLTEDNVVPFSTILFQLSHPAFTSARQLIGNSIVLMPLAVYAPELWPRLRDWRWFAALALGFAVGIELTQLAGSLLEGFTYRVTDVDDAIMNATGAVVAFFVWRHAAEREPVRSWFASLPAAPVERGAPAAEPGGAEPARFSR
jgi:glycopeptide antibiotics resistance protein